MKFTKEFKHSVTFKFKLDREQLFCLAIVLYYFWQSMNLFIQKGVFGQKILLIANYGVLIVALGFIFLGYFLNRVASFVFVELLVAVVFFISYIYDNADNGILI